MDLRAIYFSESFCTVSVRFVQRWNKHLQNCNFLCLVYQWNEIKIQRERGVQCSSNINSIFDSRDKFVIRSLGLENQNQELNRNKANCYHERKSANDESRVIVLDLWLGTLTLRYWGLGERGEEEVHHLEVSGAGEARSGTMMSW